MRFHSIKWRITAFFILLSTGFMGIYVLVTKQTFESDKISYVFESKQIENEQYAQNIAQQISRVLFDARAVLAGLSPETRRLSPASDRLFHGQDLLIGIQAQDAQSGNVLFSLEKEAGLNSHLPPAADGAKEDLRITRMNGSRFLAETVQLAEGSTPVKVRIVFDIRSPFKEAATGEMLALLNQGSVVLDANATSLKVEDLESFISSHKTRAAGETAVEKLKDERYLLSSSLVKGTSLSVVSALQQKVALKALGVLYIRSAIFLTFAFFSTILLALVASNSITRSISDLKRVAERIGEGDFDASPEFEPTDEMGTLSLAFKHMGQEIKKLLKETAQKVRMEAELKTAKIVQNSLFPKNKVHQAGSMRSAGLNASSTECSGDWWYHYEKGGFLYVMIADATGHGTPAALLTAASRSLFSYIQTADHTLSETAALWNEAIYQCYGGAMCMTAQLMKINTATGDVEVVNASHEPPYVLTSKDDVLAEYQVDHVSLVPSARIGEESTGDWPVQHFKIKPGDFLVLYTDGIYDVKNLAGKPYKQRMLIQRSKELAAKSSSAEGMTCGIYETLQKYGEGIELIDDITLVTVQFVRPAFSEAYLKIG